MISFLTIVQFEVMLDFKTIFQYQLFDLRIPFNINEIRFQTISRYERLIFRDECLFHFQWAQHSIFFSTWTIWNYSYIKNIKCFDMKFNIFVFSKWRMFHVVKMIDNLTFIWKIVDFSKWRIFSVSDMDDNSCFHMNDNWYFVMNYIWASQYELNSIYSIWMTFNLSRHKRYLFFNNSYR